MPVVSAQTGDVISLPCRVKGFKDVLSIELELGWSETALQFESLQFGNNALGLSVANFNAGIPGRLKSTWFDPNAVGIDLPDSTIIFTLNLRVLDPAPGIYPVTLLGDDPLFNSVNIEPDGAISFAFKTGGAYVNTTPVSDLAINEFCMNNSSCFNPGGTIIPTFSGGTPPYTYSWTGPDGFTSNASSLSNLLPGYYYLTVTDQNNAKELAMINLIGGGQPLQVTGQITNASCAQNDGCIQLLINSGQPPFSFSWSTADTVQQLCGLSPGAYAVTVTGANGCTRTSWFNLPVSNSLQLNTAGTASNCISGQAGTAAALPKNGIPPYQYAWNTGDTTPVIVGLYAGAYSVTVTDAGGCTGTGTTTINDAAVMSWGLELLPRCPAGNQPAGHITLRATDPSGIHFPVTLQWSNGTTSVPNAPAGDTLETLGGLPFGVYRVTITDSLGCAQMLETALNCLLDLPKDSAAFVWPGDADQNRAVNHHDLLYLGLGFGASGPARPNASVQWIGQPASDWPESTPQRAVNFRHLDANGDGMINAADTLPIAANWGQVINPLADDPFNIPKSVPGMAPTPAPALSFPADTLFTGQTSPLPVILGSAGAPAGNLHGISFSVSYDPGILRPLYFEPMPSWFGDPADGLLCIQRHFPGQHRIDVALSRTDGVPVSGNGIIGRMFIVIEDDIFLRKPLYQTEDLSGGDDAEIVTKLYMRNIQGLTPDNTQPEIAPAVTPLVIRQLVRAEEPEKRTSAVRVWPNPVREQLNVAAEDELLRAVEVFDLAGRRVAYFPNVAGSGMEIRLTTWLPGFYTVFIQTDRGVYQQTIIRL